MSTAPPPLHPAIAPLAFLLGAWTGTGTGGYPTIEPFGYRETIQFSHSGKPFLAYSQRTNDAEDDRPLHAEAGYWRLAPDGRTIEAVLAHPTGVTEVLAGTLSGDPTTAAIILMASTSVVTTPTAKAVSEITRRFEIAGNDLNYDMAMAAVGQPLTHHLHANLTRQTRQTR